MRYYSGIFLFSLFGAAISAPGSLTTVAPPLPTFILKLVHTHLTFNNVSLSGTFGQLDLGDGPLVGFNGAPRSSAVALSLNAAGNLVIDQLDIIGYQDPGQTEELLHFDSVADVTANGGVPAVCDVGSGELKCQAAKGNKHLVLCPGEAVTNDLFLVDKVEDGCSEVKLKVVSVK